MSGSACQPVIVLAKVLSKAISSPDLDTLAFTLGRNGRGTDEASAHCTEFRP